MKSKFLMIFAEILQKSEKEKDFFRKVWGFLLNLGGKWYIMR